MIDAGPEAGRRVPLMPGTHTVGRQADVSIDDPSLSGNHVVLTVGANGDVTVTDAGSRNGSVLDGMPLQPGEAVQLEPGRLVRAGRSLFGVATPEPVARPAGGEAGLLQVNRPPRVRRPPQRRRRPFPAPPAEPQRARLPLGASLIPLALGVGLFLLTHLPTMLFFSLLSPVMAVTTYAEDRRSGRKGFQTHSRDYRRSLVSLRDELDAERASEVDARRAAAPSAPELIARARRHDPSLWERRPGDEDFLELRLGTADLPSLLSVEVDAGGSPDLRREAESVVGWYAIAPAVPLAVHAADAGTVGIAGPRERVDGLTRWLVAQAAALHSPAELVVAAALGPRRRVGLAEVASAHRRGRRAAGGAHRARPARGAPCARGGRPAGRGAPRRGLGARRPEAAAAARAARRRRDGRARARARQRAARRRRRRRDRALARTTASRPARRVDRGRPGRGRRRRG